jgi:voltage-gated potassium channel
MTDIFFLILGRLRTPIIALIAIYAVSVLGLVLIPGVDNLGRPYSMDFFHAFYFISYTATTIGFGELPYPFTSAQRMWVMICVYMTVIGWTFTLGSIFSLSRDRTLVRAIKYRRFSGKVSSISEPFYLICGYGQTSILLCNVLNERNSRFVVIESREERVNEVAFAHYHFDTPFFAGDAANPELLKVAGLAHPMCRGVVGITGDEACNLAIAISAYVLRPEMLSICRSNNQSISENMASFGANKIINLFEAVGQQFKLALDAPEVSYLHSVLFDFPGEKLPERITPPRGHWVIVGYGRFGRAMHAALTRDGVTVSIIDPGLSADPDQTQFHRALGVDAKSLLAAGIDRAVGLVVCHDQDTSNLSAIATARAIQPKLFVYARQNVQTNHMLFKAFKPDFTSVRREVMAHDALRVMATPFMTRFVEHTRSQSDAWALQLTERIQLLCKGRVPESWTITLNAKNIAAVYAFLAKPTPPLQLAHFSKNVLDLTKPLNCIALLRRNMGKDKYLPSDDQKLSFGDVLLFIGDDEACQSHYSMCEDITLLDYARTGMVQPQSWIFRKLALWRAGEGG